VYPTIWLKEAFNEVLLGEFGLNMFRKEINRG